MDLKLSEKLYYHEEQRKNELLNSLTFVLGVLGLVLGLLAFYVSNYFGSLSSVQHLSGSWQQIFHFSFIGLLFIDFLLVSVSIFFVVKSFHNYTYRYLPSPKEIHAYYLDLNNYYVGQANAKKQINNDFQDYMISEYIASADHNDKNNISRKKSIHQATRWTIISLVCLGLTFIPFFFHHRSNEVSVLVKGFESELGVKINDLENQIEKLESISKKKEAQKMADKEKEITPAKSPREPQKTKPEPPPPRYIKESEDKATPKS